MKRRLKLFLGPIILLATVAVIARYLSEHTYLLTRLAHTPLKTIVLVILIDFFAFASGILILRATAAMYGKNLTWRDNFLVSAYSSLINFFGPGQSGPAVRGAYLKKRVGLKIKDYTFASIVYYVCFAVLSGLLVLAGQAPWWLTALTVIILGIASVLVVKRVMQKRLKEEKSVVRPASVGWIFVATALQMLTQILLYSVELHAVTHMHFAQVLTYTGVANFALFVALTPGAIGIRESFLVFSEKLHHISSAAIVSANIIDRGVYILFLGVLFVFVLALHAKERIAGKPNAAQSSTDVE
ncbi:MAG TPA: lysylphosphatidylglycerol synthase domain-containing protein [Candidatus Saccharimonadales bacterium]